MDVLDRVKKYLEAGQELELQGKFDKALFFYDQAAEHDNSYWPVRSHRVRTLYQMGRFSDAEHLLKDYLQSVDATFAAALNDLGVIQSENGDLDGAITCFTQAMKAPSPITSPLVLGNLAYVFYCKKQLDECVKCCDEALQLDPDETRVHYILSVAEASRYMTRMQLASDMVREGATIQVFPALRFESQLMSKYNAGIEGEENPQVHLLEPVSLTRPGTHWGILLPHLEELWCTFALQSAASAEGVEVLVGLPDRFFLVQRRRWVRVSATGALARLEVRSFPPGAEPFKVMELFELNLSAGGAAIRTTPKLPPQTEVTLFLKISEKEEMKVQARVVRTGRPEYAEPYTALAYMGMDERERDKIAHFVHAVQLQRKRRPWTRK